MQDNELDTIRSALLAIVIGILAALAIANFAACEEDDSFCAFTGVSSK